MKQAKQTKKYHSLDFFHLVLYLVFAVVIVLYLFFSRRPDLQKDLIFFTAIFYFIWSLFYHFQKKDLSLPLLLEYLFFILLALVLVITTLIRS